MQQSNMIRCTRTDPLLSRAGDYPDNFQTLVAGMREMGFAEYLRPELQGTIITAIRTIRTFTLKSSTRG
jgi:hypothetical protein